MNVPELLKSFKQICTQFQGQIVPLIQFDGPPSCGKTLLASRMADWFNSQGDCGCLKLTYDYNLPDRLFDWTDLVQYHADWTTKIFREAIFNGNQPGTNLIISDGWFHTVGAMLGLFQTPDFGGTIIQWLRQFPFNTSIVAGVVVLAPDEDLQSRKALSKIQSQRQLSLSKLYREQVEATKADKTEPDLTGISMISTENHLILVENENCDSEVFDKRVESLCQTIVGLLQKFVDKHQKVSQQEAQTEENNQTFAAEVALFNQELERIKHDHLGNYAPYSLAKN